jgi:hypothetical protein
MKEDFYHIIGQAHPLKHELRGMFVVQSFFENGFCRATYPDMEIPMFNNIISIPAEYHAPDILRFNVLFSLYRGSNWLNIAQDVGEQVVDLINNVLFASALSSDKDIITYMELRRPLVENVVYKSPDVICYSPASQSLCEPLCEGELTLVTIVDVNYIGYQYNTRRTRSRMSLISHQELQSIY